MRYLRPLLLALFVLAMPALAACSDSTGANQRLITLFVGDTQVDCPGIGQQKCLLVKSDAAANWTFFYDTIEGFDWKPGYEYKLLVAVREIDPPPVDGSSLAYRLVRVLEKTRVYALP